MKTNSKEITITITDREAVILHAALFGSNDDLCSKISFQTNSPWAKQFDVTLPREDFKELLEWVSKLKKNAAAERRMADCAGDQNRYNYWRDTFLKLDKMYDILYLALMQG